MDEEEFDDAIRNSHFLLKQILDSSEGLSIALQCIVELLMAKGLLTPEEIIDAMRREAKLMSDPPESLARITLEEFLHYLEKYAASGLPALRSKLLRQRRKEKTVGCPRPRRKV
jgi:hypothetical protein